MQSVRVACVLSVLLFGHMQRETALAGSAPDAPAEPPPALEAAFKKAVRIKLEGIISSMTHEYMKRQLKRAQEALADLVIIEVESPGGDAQASIDIAQDLANIKWAKTVAYVPKEAISGGAFVCLGCDEIVLLPGARIGDAGPIVLGSDSLFRHAPEKIVSYLAESIRTIAEQKGHPPSIAEAMVDKDLNVFHYRHATTGENKCMSEAEFIQRDDRANWEKVKPVFGSGNGRFLTLNGKSALEVGLAAANVTSDKQIEERYHLANPPTVFVRTWVDTLVAVLNLPIVTGLLLVAGLVLLYVELSVPGVGIFGISSAACFVLFFWAQFLGGTADWLEVLLFIGGIACIGVELFLMPGTAIFGVTGFLMVVAGLTMAITPAAGQFVNMFDSITASAATIGTSLAVVLVVGVILARFLGTLPMVRRMMLAPPEGSVQEAFFSPAAGVLEAEVSVQVGQQGVARTPLRPSGKARFGEVEIDVIAENAFVSAGSAVRVIVAQGNRIVVRESGDNPS